jgi:hypothetical protein
MCMKLASGISKTQSQMSIMGIELVLEHSMAVLTSKVVFSGRRARGKQVSSVTAARRTRTSRKQSETKIEEASSDMMEVLACTFAGISSRAGRFMHDGCAAA